VGRYTDERLVSEELKEIGGIGACLVVDEVTVFDIVRRSHFR
jgi:hypothetical protein